MVAFYATPPIIQYIENFISTSQGRSKVVRRGKQGRSKEEEKEKNWGSLVNTCVSLADYYKEKNLNNTFWKFKHFMLIIYCRHESGCKYTSTIFLPTSEPILKDI